MSRFVCKAVFERHMGIGVLICAFCAMVGLAPQVEGQTCNIDDTNVGCDLGCEEGECGDSECELLVTDPVVISRYQVESNFLGPPRANLFLIQAGNKENKFQANAREILRQLGVAPEKRKDVASVQAAIDAIKADFDAKQVPVDVVIIGHGRAGSIKVGEDRLNMDTAAGRANVAAFVLALRGKISKLYLFGCKTAAGQAGQDLLGELERGLAAPVHGWADTVRATSKQTQPPSKFMSKPGTKKELPALPGWAGVVLAGLLFVGGIFVFGRRRREQTT